MLDKRSQVMFALITRARSSFAPRYDEGEIDFGSMYEVFFPLHGPINS